MHPSSSQFPTSNVKVLRNLDSNATTTSPSFDQSLGRMKASLGKDYKDGKPEVTAQAGRSVKKATGETTSEARQKAYNAASTEHTENLKSGKFAQQETKADSMSRFPSKGAPIKIDSGKAK
jgi:hypothetical protein